MAERQLTRPQEFALILEAHSARQLLGSGSHLLVSSHGIDGKFDALATMWSIGVEKLLKLTLGLSQIASGGPWPDGKNFGHNLVQMDARLSTQLHAWATATPPSPWVESLLDRLRNDQIWPALLAVLDNYARSGRFAYLDRLAEVTSPPREPRSLWPDVESAALAGRIDLRDVIFGGLTIVERRSA